MAGVGTNVSNNPLKDSLGRHRTMSLFYEHRIDKYPALWTLSEYDVEKDGVVYKSLRNIYLSYNHIPGHEYEFAKDLFNSWTHWSLLVDSNLKHHIKEWREELEIKNKALEIKNLMLASKSGDTAAAKYLSSKGYEGTATRRGRPSKAEISQNLKAEQRARAETDEEEARILSIVGRNK